MAYADGSNPSVRKDMGVRLPSPAPLAGHTTCAPAREPDRSMTNTSSVAARPGRATASGALALLSVLMVAANLRPALTAVGPLVGLIGNDLGLGATALGVLGAVPLVAFAVVSPLVHQLGRRLGHDRAVLVASAVLVVGTGVRSLPGTGTLGLWLGTALLGGAIAVSNVTLPALIKRDFAREVPLVTGVYTAVLSTTAAFASGLALPIARVGGWRLGVGIWGLLSVLALLAWLPRSLRAGRPPAAPGTVPVGDGALGAVAEAGPRPARPPRRSMWSSAVAWQVTAVMGTQATTFYLLVTWLPTIEMSHGVPAVTAGWYLFLYQVVGVVGGLLVTVFMRGRADHRLAGAGVTAAMLVGVLGLLLVPSLSLLWIMVAGLSGGGSLVVALALVGERSRTAADAAQLSGMVQSIGYLLAVAGPIGAGVLFELSGGWTWPLVALAGVGVVQLVVVWLAGRDRFV